MINILLLILTNILAMICKDERDNLRYKKKNVFFPEWGWYTENRWNTKSKILKNYLTLFNDGDQWWEWWNEAIKYYAISYVGYFVIGYNHWWANGIAIGSFAIGGLIHSWRDGSLTRDLDK